MAQRERASQRTEATVKSAAEAQRGEIRDEADGIMASLRDQESDARNVVSSIGALGITGGFGEYAHQQKRRADIWNIVTIVSLVIASLPGAVYFVSINIGIQQPVDLERFLERILTGGPLYVIAGYAAIQGARSRENERWARAKELELAAIGPYLARLDHEQRTRVLVEMAPRYFGQTTSARSGSEGIATATVVKALEDARKPESE